MIEMGILDPAKVTRTALQAAGSVAGLMITTEVMIADSPKDDAPAPAMPDMGGMGGMNVIAPAWFNNPATGRVFYYLGFGPYDILLTERGL